MVTGISGSASLRTAVRSEFRRFSSIVSKVCHCVRGVRERRVVGCNCGKTCSLCLIALGHRPRKVATTRLNRCYIGSGTNISEVLGRVRRSELVCHRNSTRHTELGLARGNLRITRFIGRETRGTIHRIDDSLPRSGHLVVCRILSLVCSGLRRVDRRNLPRKSWVDVGVVVSSAASVSPHVGSEVTTIIPAAIHFNRGRCVSAIRLSERHFCRLLFRASALPTADVPAPSTFTHTCRRTTHSNSRILMVAVSKGLSKACRSTVVTTRSFSDMAIISSGSMTVNIKVLIRFTIQLVSRNGALRRVIRTLRSGQRGITMVTLLSALRCLGGNKEVSSTITFTKAILGLGPIIYVRSNRYGVLNGTENSGRNGGLLVSRVRGSNNISCSLPIVLNCAKVDSTLLVGCVRSDGTL